jgi:predicted DNA binding CopG/RHH family protein
MQWWHSACTVLRSAIIEFLGKETKNAGLAAGCCRLKISGMPEFALIACRVTSETKARVRCLAEREGITESTLLRQLLEVVLLTAGLDEPSAMAPVDKVIRDARLNVRLAPEDSQLLKERAKARGMASATYLSYLARYHLRDAAPLPKAEYTLLKQSVEQLAAFGRNLHQIARAMNRGEHPSMPGRAQVASMLEISEGLRQHFRALLEANSRSWRSSHAPTPH